MRKILALICIVFTITFLTSCGGISQDVEYRFDEYEIQTWDNWNHYNSVIYTTDMKSLDSLKKLELVRAEKSIKKLKELNSIWK